MAIVRTHFLDTSAMIKLVVDEEGSAVIRGYQSIGSVFWTTSICFAEALGVLKVKYFYRKEISKEKYLASTYDLVSRLKNNDIILQPANKCVF
jgi:predicted nucleic acid-binding protein